MNKVLLFVSIGITLVSFTRCSPKIYLIDRQTVMEDEAAGEWPDFEKDLLDKSKALGPIPFAKTANTARKDHLYRVLNGELTYSNSTQKKD